MLLDLNKIETLMANHQPPMRQGDLARACGFHQSFLCKKIKSISAGEHVTPVFAATLAKGLGTRVSALVEKDESKVKEA